MKEVYTNVFRHLYIQYLADGLLFVPRKKNNARRLEAGYWFRGNDRYLSIGFCKGDDNNQKICNIGFAINSSGESYLEISSRDDRQVYAVLLGLLDQVSGLREERDGVLVKYYSEGGYLQCLDTFIQDDLPSIQQYLSKHSSEKLSNLGADDREAIERVFEMFKASQGASATGLPATRLNEDVIHRLVLEQEVLIKPMHKLVQNILADFLRNNGCRDVCVEQDYVDVSAIEPDGTHSIYEVKPMAVKYALRLGLGQLLDYASKSGLEHCNLYVVSNYRPTAGDVDFLSFIDSRLKMQLKFVYVDITTKSIQYY